MSQIDTFVLFYFFTYCIMMVVKMAATTAIVKYVLVKFGEARRVSRRELNVLVFIIQ